jgi:hypothetical protein
MSEFEEIKENDDDLSPEIDDNEVSTMLRTTSFINHCFL